jgi:eukaryotic-like serine/threonine-protein kinase
MSTQSALSWPEADADFPPSTQRSHGPPACKPGRYEIVAELGRGGMAEVVLAVLCGPGAFRRLFAIKRALAPPHVAPDSARALLHEAHIAGLLDHPNVVPVLAVGGTAAAPHLVMPYVEGIPLGSLIARARRRGLAVPVRVALRVVRDALEGLVAVHEMTDADGQPTGVLHRDIKPQNILVGLDGVSRILDFGVSSFAKEAGRPTVGLVGTLAYMAPEQALGGPSDGRSDLFSMGVVLWELLAGDRLFAPKAREALAGVLHTPIPNLRDRCPELDAPTEDACMRALALDPDLRYSTARAMADAIEDAAHVTPGIASPCEVGRIVHLLAGDLMAERRAAAVRER